MDLLTDERGVVLAWLTRVALTLAILGVILFDASSVAVNYFGLDSTANDLVIAASTTVGSEGGLTQEQVRALEETAEQHDAKLVKVELRPDGILFLKLRREAYTLVAGHVSAFDDWIVATAEATASTQ